MMNKAPSAPLTEERQYLAMKQALARAGYDHEAHVEECPKSGHGSLVFSVFKSSHGHAGFGVSSVEYDQGGPCGSVITGEGRGREGGMITGASSMYGGITNAGGASGGLMYSPVSPGSFSHKRYAHTVRSSTSSIMSLGRQKAEPPVMILPHYNSPYEAIYFNQPDVIHFVGKDLRIGTVCISAKQGHGAMHFLVRTVLKFVNVDIADDYRSTSEFDQYRSLYPKMNALLPMLHLALQQCLESIPESEINRHQVVRHQSAADHSVFVLDDPGWLQNPRHISNLVRGLEEIRQEGFGYVLKNLEAQMRPAALTMDIVIPNQESSIESGQDRFWSFFNGLGDHIEAENCLLYSTKPTLNMSTMATGDESEEQRSEALSELIETEISYNKRMLDLVNVYLKEARSSIAELSSPFSKYDVRVIFSNIEQIAIASTTFLRDLRDYQSEGVGDLNLGDICRKNLQAMECYKEYLMRYKRAQKTHRALQKKSPAYRAFQDKCIETHGVQTLSNLLIEPTQRIVKYPLLFKAILSGTTKDSAEVDGLRDAAETASQIAHMEKAKPEQRAEILFNLRGLIENCPDSLLSQNRSVVAYLDGFETHLLTGERGRPITIILFSDKVMIVRRPKGVNGEALFQLKDDGDIRKRKEREEKEKRHKKDSARPNKDDHNELEDVGVSRVSGSIVAGFNILRKDWKFLGWMDLLRLKVSVVEQTDPEGLFCITTRNHTETKEDPWETTRGIMPAVLDKRDVFISKFHETLALAKAAAISSGVDYTSRLHVAELELFCNVFTESQYRDFKYKGDVALFYTSSTNYPVDVTPFTRLPLFVGMIQASEAGFRAILRSRASLNGAGDSISMDGDSNLPLDTDAFQIHISELVANLQWTAYSFDPYQSTQLHFSRVYMDTDYLYKTASTFSRTSTLRTKGLKNIRDGAGSTAFLGRTSSVHQYTSGHRHHHTGSFSPLTSPCDVMSMPGSPGGGLVGRSPSIISYNSNYGCHSVNGGAPALSPISSNKRFSMPAVMHHQSVESATTLDSTDGDSSSTYQSHPPLPLPKQQLAASTFRNSVSVMSLLIPGTGRKKGLLSSLVFGGGKEKQ